MKCPTSTGVHARPTMYQEGVPRGAIKNFLPRVWSALPALGYMLGLQCIRKECPEGQYKFSPQSMKCPTSTGVHARPNVSGRSAQRGNKKNSPQSMKCPTSTGVHARPTMYQEGVPRGAIKKFLPRVWSALPALGYMLGLQCIRKECPEAQ